jgi:hypothetical protein
LRRAGKIACLAAIALAARAEIIDRIAVSVGNSIITTSDLDIEIRVTAALNGVQPDFSSANRRATADRLVEQKLIRRELDLTKYMLPDASVAQPRFDEFRKAHPDALAAYGITEQQIRDALLWQLTLLRFIEVRFRPGIQVSDQDIAEYFDKVVKPAAQTAHPGEPVSLEDYRSQIEETLTGQRTDQEVDTWLKDGRKRTDIVFHAEVFQ